MKAASLTFLVYWFFIPALLAQPLEKLVLTKHELKPEQLNSISFQLSGNFLNRLHGAKGEKLSMPVLLIIGDHDNTAPGKQFAPPEVRAQLGNYPVLAKAAIKRMPQGRLIEFAELGHSPQIQDPARFHKALLEALKP